MCKTMRTAIYARYSSDNQRDASIEDQVRLCNELVKSSDWSLSNVYSDAALSGANLLRPGIQSLLNACFSGKVDIVVAEALDRISRDQEDMAGIFKRLTFAGVRLITLSEGEITDLHVGLKGTMNALYLKDLADKTRRGLRGRVEAGRSGGGNSYGYDVVDSSDDNRGRRRINKFEAKIIIRVFKEYAAGKSPRKIAFDLNRDSIPGPAGKDWGPSTINGNRTRGTGILNNELYIGRLVWNRLRYIKNPDTGKRVSKLNPKEVWVINETLELRIVPQELWDTVKGRQESVKKNTRPDIKTVKPFWQKTRPKYLLSGLMKCDSCGGNYTKISQNLFGCATARNKGTCDNRLNIRTDTVEEIILNGLRDNLMDPDLFKTFAEEFVAEVNRVRLEGSADSDAARSELSRLENQIDKLVMAIANGADAIPLNTKIKELESRQHNLQVKVINAADAEPLIHPNLAEIYRAKIENLAALLDDPKCQAEAFDIIRYLVDEVRLIPDTGQLRIELKGELAGILSLCDTKKKPTTSYEERAEQVKMVAGVGFEPTTFRL
jgi:site-specific DNA recombinase